MKNKATPLHLALARGLCWLLSLGLSTGDELLVSFSPEESTEVHLGLCHLGLWLSPLAAEQISFS